MHLVFFVSFNWIKVIIRRSSYPGDDLGWLYPICFFSVFGMLIALGTIDGKGTGNLHTVGAVFFFIMLYFFNLNITVTIKEISRWDPSSFSQSSVTQKVIVCAWLTLVILYSLIGLVLEQIKNN